MAESSSENAGRWTALSYSSDYDTRFGIAKLNSYLRSIVISSNVFELFVGFNREMLADGLWGKVVRRKDKLTDFRLTEKEKKKHYLSEPARALGSSSEPHLKHEMANKLEEFEHLDTTATARSTDEKHVIMMLEGTLERLEDFEAEGQPPCLDISIGVRDRLLAFVQVGLTENECEGEETQSRIDEELDKLFWKKVDQSISHLDTVRTTSVKDKKKKGDHRREFRVSGTVLLCVLVLDGGRKRGRLAVFASEPRGKSRRARDPSFRMALLWRREAALDQLDIGYGQFIKAAFEMKEWECGPSSSSSWEYLGPNCSKVTIDGQESYVLRAYDTRVCSTSRSPYLYNTMIELEAQRVLSIEDEGEGEIMAFGEEASSGRFSMLFCDPTVNKRGKVEVIAVPFLEGSHICTHVDQAIAVLEMLQELHKKNLVHGDIRGFNIVFSDEPAKSALIDFDFGGKVGTVKYPPEYVLNLKDGDRRETCEGGALIEKQDDVYAIFYVLFSKHALPESVTPEIALAHLKSKKEVPTTIEDLLARFSRLKDAGVLEMEAEVGYARYIAHLEAAS